MPITSIQRVTMIVDATSGQGTTDFTGTGMLSQVSVIAPPHATSYDLTINDADGYLVYHKALSGNDTTSPDCLIKDDNIIQISNAITGGVYRVRVWVDNGYTF